MKRAYEKPVLAIESFELNANIAVGCTTVVTFGPGGVPGEDPCAEFPQYPDVPMRNYPHIPPGGHPNFYEANCDCYITAGNSTYFTS